MSISAKYRSDSGEEMKKTEGPYHFIGIGGIGMSGLARLLLEQKQKVSGSDRAWNATVESLLEQGAEIYKGHAEKNILAAETVVYSTDIATDNVELLAAKTKGCTLLHRAELLAELITKSTSLAVAGTHGKTTTSSLLATLLIEAQLDPSFAIGGMLPAYKTNARIGKGKYFVIEADESDRSFLNYHPHGAIVTNIDFDHLSQYDGNRHLLIASFKKFILQIKEFSHFFYCGDDVYLSTMQLPGVSYGKDPSCKCCILSSYQKQFRSFFTIRFQDQVYSDIELALIGNHNILNATAVFGLGISLGVSEACIRKAFKTFQGVLRRCEKKGVYREVSFYDDYAHHPTEIQATLQGIRKAIGQQRLIAVFQPHRFSRTKECQGLYGNIFNDANHVILTDTYAAGEKCSGDFSSKIIQKEIQNNPAFTFEYISYQNLSHHLSRLVQPNDVVITLGAGNITTIAAETIALLMKENE
jgi:UDP-N-acetylmuramate--alanine ligase